MNKQSFVALLIVVVAAVAAIVAIARVQCHIRWEGSTLEWRVDYLVCKVNHPTLGWVPEDRIRGME